MEPERVKHEQRTRAFHGASVEPYHSLGFHFHPLLTFHLRCSPPLTPQFAAPGGEFTPPGVESAALGGGIAAPGGEFTPLGGKTAAGGGEEGASVLFGRGSVEEGAREGSRGGLEGV